MNGDGDGDGAGTRTGWRRTKERKVGTGTGTGTGVETRGRTQEGNGDRSGDISKSSSGNEDGIGEGGEEVKKRKKPHRSCRRDVGNGGYLGGKRKKHRQERVSPVAADPDNLENNKETGGGHNVLRD